MNLAKKSTILLAALSVFAMTSCNNGTKKLSYKDALKWVEKHYSEAKTREASDCKVSWDYSSNNETNSTPKDWGTGDEQPGNKKLNWFIQYSLKTQFEVTDEKEVTKSKSSSKIKGSGVIGDDDLKKSLTPESFKFFEGKDDYTFEVNGNNLTIKWARDYLEEGRQIPIVEGTYLMVYYLENDTWHYDKDGFLTTFDVVMDADDTKVEFYYSGAKQKDSQPLGKLSTQIYTSPIVK